MTENYGVFSRTELEILLKAAEKAPLGSLLVRLGTKHPQDTTPLIPIAYAPITELNLMDGTAKTGKEQSMDDALTEHYEKKAAQED